MFACMLTKPAEMKASSNNFTGFQAKPCRYRLPPPLPPTHLVTKHGVNLKSSVDPVRAVLGLELKTRKKCFQINSLFRGNGDTGIWKMGKHEEGK